MEDKKQDVNSLVEFKKAVVEFGNMINGFVEGLSKLLNDIEIPDEEEDTWEMKCPYENNDDIYSLSNDGEVKKNYWSYFDYDLERFEQGNIFPTKEAAEIEGKRRDLLTRFRSFRDECNGDWKVDLKRSDNKFYISYSDNMLGLCVYSFGSIEGFNLFGCFKNKEDAERAIELFGDEIEELFVEGE